MADLHSWRQADTAAVARNLVNDNFDVLHPRILSAVSIDGMGRDNKDRYHFAEFPLYQVFVATGSFLTGDIVTSGRIVSIVSSLVSVVVLFLLTRRYYSDRVAFLSAFVFGLLPYNVFWSRTVLPDPMMIMFCLLSLLFFDAWVRDSSKPFAGDPKLTRNYVLALVFFGCAMLLKAFPLFLLIPMSYLLLKKRSLPWMPLALLAIVPVIGWNVYKEIIDVRPMRLWMTPALLVLGIAELYLIYRFREYLWKLRDFFVMIFVALIPLGLWRIWMQQWPMSIPASSWLFDGKNLRLKPAWWHWIFQQRLSEYMFNFSGLLFIGLGLLFNKELLRRSELPFQLGSIVQFIKQIFHIKRTVGKQDIAVYAPWFFPLSFATCLLYFVVFATGNVTHEYYQIVIIPFGSVLVATGFWYMWDFGEEYWELVIRRLSALALLGITLLLGWYSVRDWYTIGNPMQITIGARADLLLPKDALVIAPYGGDTTFLYYINRSGWSVIDKRLQEMIDRGATHFVSNYRDDGTNRVARLYTIVEETQEYVIVDLRQKSNDPEWATIGTYEL